MDHLQRSLLNYFSMQPLDRVAHLRADEQWIKSKMTDPDSCFYVLQNDRIITVDDNPLCMNADQLDRFGLNNSTPCFLGNDAVATSFAVNLDEIESIRPSFPQAQSHSLRDLADTIDMKTASILTYALLMNHWLASNRYCRRCGSHYRSEQGGHVLKCKSASCKHTEFPRINPAVIMRVTCNDKILLARQANWPENRFSVLAGFVETGETLEHAVKREIKEEAGIEVEQIYYHSSQPWPFPNSLMIGYTAQTSDMTLDIEKDDLESAIWLDADELIQHMNERSVILSPPISISHRLIEDWFMEKTGRSVKDWQSVKPEHIVHENE